jgi:hypothetical protein
MRDSFVEIFAQFIVARCGPDPEMADRLLRSAPSGRSRPLSAEPEHHLSKAAYDLPHLPPWVGTAISTLPDVGVLRCSTHAPDSTASRR